MCRVFYSTSEVASLFRINRVTVYRWIKEGKIKAYSIGKHLKVPLSEVERMLQEFGFDDIVSDFRDDGREHKEIGSYITSLAKDGNRKKLVVAVHDDSRILEMMAELFTRRKLDEVCQLYTFSDSLDAAMRIGRQRPDIVLLDFSMPGLNGPELLKKIGAFHKKVKIVVMNGDPAVEKKSCSGGAEIVRNLMKPIASAELYETIVEALH